MRKITTEQYKWKINFEIDFPLDPSNELEWKKDNIGIESKDGLIENIEIKSKDTSIEGTIAIENDSGDQASVKEEAREILYTLLDSYFVLNDQVLRIKELHDPILTNETGLKVIVVKGEEFKYDIQGFIRNENLDECFNFFEKFKSYEKSDWIERILRWFRRGLDELDELDEFIYYWISFNAFYGHYKNRYEHQQFLEAIEQNIDENTSENILEREKNKVDLLISGNIVRKNRMGQIQEELSKELKDNRADNEYKEALKYAVKCIYQVRCSVFHGDKEYIELIDSCISILKYVIRECLSLLFGEYR